MKNSICFICLSFSLFTLAACDNSGKQITESVDAPAVSLGDIRSQLNSGDVRTTVAPEIDPAAKNIDPFRSWYHYKERETYAALLNRARAEEGYLDRSMRATLESFEGLPLNFEPSDYRETLEKAASFEAAAKLGLMPAHEAQAQASEILKMTLPIGDWKKLDEAVPLKEREVRTSEYHKRTYLNYHLILEQMIETETPEAIPESAMASKTALPDPE